MKSPKMLTGIALQLQLLKSQSMLLARLDISVRQTYN